MSIRLVIRSITLQDYIQKNAGDALQSDMLYRGALSLIHAGDSHGGDFLIQSRKLKKVCDGLGDRVAGRL